MLKTKSYWSPIDRKRDGLRILATRFRARGSGTTRYADAISRAERMHPQEGASGKNVVGGVRARLQG